MTDANEMANQLRANLKELGVDVDALDIGSNHPYSCTCATCWRWWKAMGLGDEDSPPFTQAQIDAETYVEAMNVSADSIAAINEVVLQLARERRRNAEQ